MAEAGEGEARQGRGTKGGVIGWSHGQIVDTLASGGTVDLRGGQVRLPAPLRVEGGVQARLQNGTLVFDRFEGPAIAAQGSGSALAMSHVRVRSGVVAAEAGARLDLAEVQLESAGVVVTGAGSSLLMRNSGVTGASIGVAVVDGASGELEVVTLQGCNIGLNCERGAAVTVSGGLITGTRTGPAINVHGSSLDAQGTKVSHCEGHGVYARMVRGSNKVSVSGMVIGDCEGCGLKAEMAQGVTMEACEVVSAGGDGVAYRGATGTVTRVKVVRSGRHGCLCDRGRLEVADCEVADSEGNGLHAMPGALLLHGGTTLSGNKAGNVGIAPRLGLCSLYRKGKIKKLK